MALNKLKHRNRDWLFEAAFPRWSSNGVDKHGCFREKLNLDGSPIETETTRVRVQARQTYCFAIAKNLGWGPAEDILKMGVNTLLNKCMLPSGLPAVTIHPQHGPVNAAVDLYDVAFVLFALSHAALSLGDEKIVSAVNALLDTIETSLRHPSSDGGFSEILPPRGLREQNPHMHLLEGLLVAHQATGNPAALRMADHITDFTKRVFIDPIDGGLHEFGPVRAGAIIENDRYESGHQFEWVWLLHEKARLQSQAIEPFAKTLEQKALKLRASSGRIPLSHTLTDQPRETFMRSWGITEAIKAYCYLTRFTDSDYTADLFQAHDILYQDHLCADGTWIDRRDADGKALSTDVPASTFYHVVFALNQVLEFPGT